MNVLNVTQIFSVVVLMNLVVCHQHFLRDEVLVDLVWLDERVASVNVVVIFFTYDSGSWPLLL